MKVQTLDSIKKILNKQKPTLAKNFGVSSVGVFGSFVFGDYKETSDVDILVDFIKPIGLFKFIELENYLSGKLGRKVDLVSKNSLKKYLKNNILNSTDYA
jgi:hypothetical protein